MIRYQKVAKTFTSIALPLKYLQIQAKKEPKAIQRGNKGYQWLMRIKCKNMAFTLDIFIVLFVSDAIMCLLVHQSVLIGLSPDSKGQVSTSQTPPLQLILMAKAVGRLAE